MMAARWLRIGALSLGAIACDATEVTYRSPSRATPTTEVDCSAGRAGTDVTPEVRAGSPGAAAAPPAEPLTTLDLGALPAEAFALPPPPGVEAAHERARSIVGTLSVTEKLTLVQGVSGPYVGNVPSVASVPAITLQDGPAGVARFAQVTAFPAPIGLAASFERELAERYGRALGEEQRGKGVVVQLAPMVNLARTPLAGRNFEGFGEDPFLSAELAAHEVRGIQSQKVVATAKHFVGNEQETRRMSGDSRIGARALHELYYAPFEASVSAGVGAVMCAYNRVNGVYACEQPDALSDLKTRMGFSGWVMSDWDATHSTAAAVNAGLDMEMPSGVWFGALSTALLTNQVPVARLDDMVERILTSLIRIGAYDDPPTGHSTDNVATLEHRALAREVATKAITLLKNSADLLPLSGELGSIALIEGPVSHVLGGGGSAQVQAPDFASPVTAIAQRAGCDVRVTLSRYDDGDLLERAASADVAIVFAGVVSTEGDDRPFEFGAMTELILRVAAENPRTIVVLNTPGAVAMPWLDAVSAVLVAWYPGVEDGNALASVLFGDHNPSGRLPLSFPKSVTDLPGIETGITVDYTEGLAIGYRGLDARGLEPLFPFGFGLSYTRFEYGALELHASATTPSGLDVSFDLTNTGARAGAEVAQLYLAFPLGSGEPPRVLRGFERVELEAGERRRVHLELPPRAFTIWDETRRLRVAPSGTFEIAVGRSSRDLPLRQPLEVLGSP